MVNNKKKIELKNYIIGTLAVGIILLFSFMYKNSKTPLKNFPISKETRARVDKNMDAPLFLYVFLSKHNCHDCLQVLKELNDLPPQFVVTGIVPKEQLKDEQEVRSITGVEFPLISIPDYAKYRPWYTPSIMGVSPFSKIIFTLPGVPKQKVYIKKFLNSLYEKIYPIFIDHLTK